jgi:peptide deformylase
MIYDLVPDSDPILREVMPKFDFSNPPINPIELGTNLAETMLYHGGLGLAANQVGLRYNVFVMHSQPVLVCYNPRIVDQTSEEVKLMEGCLTYPNLYLNISRARTIKVRFALPNGEVETHTWTDMTARIFQHEFDHLQGILYTDRVSKLELELARKKRKKLLRS